MVFGPRGPAFTSNHKEYDSTVSPTVLIKRTVGEKAGQKDTQSRGQETERRRRVSERMKEMIRKEIVIKFLPLVPQGK